MTAQRDWPYAKSAGSYLEGGWHPIRVPWGKKDPVPKGVTGHGGHPLTIDTVKMWVTKPALGKAQATSPSSCPTT
jgi:hypothetical protein